MATQSFIKNYITSILSEDGTAYQNHEHKVAIIWQSYKDGLGKSINPTMLFNLDELIQSHDLSDLNEPFTMDEIENVAKEFPTDRAPGPDGVNGMFLKKAGIL